MHHSTQPTAYQRRLASGKAQAAGLLFILRIPVDVCHIPQKIVAHSLG